MSEQFDVDIWAKGVKPIIGPVEVDFAELTLLRTLRQLPKCELHIHIEGSIHLDDVKQLANKYGRVESRPALQGFADYDSFFDAWFQTTALLREPADFLFVARGFVQRLQRAGVVWCEAFVSPPDLEMREHYPLSFSATLQAWIDALKSCDEVAVRLIVDLVRLYPSQKAALWLDDLLRIRDQRQADSIIGIGLGGPQDANPLPDYRETIKRAKREGLLCVVHAGERGSISDVANAVFDVKADRLGHAIGLKNNPEAYEEVLLRQIPIEACPTSNIRLGCIDKIENHPVSRWFDDGALVTINTDDPAFLQTELCLEYLHLHRAFGWGEYEFRELIINGFRASKMPSRRRDEMIRTLKS